MKKVFATLAVIMVLVLATSSLAFANTGNGPGYDTCPQDYLDDEQKVLFNDIIAAFQDSMAAVKEKMNTLREAGDYEQFQAAKAERLDLMEAKREALLEIVPAEFADRFGASGQSRRHNGVEKGSAGFRGGSEGMLRGGTGNDNSMGAQQRLHR